MKCIHMVVLLNARLNEQIISRESHHAYVFPDTSYLEYAQGKEMILT